MKRVFAIGLALFVLFWIALVSAQAKVCGIEVLLLDGLEVHRNAIAIFQAGVESRGIPHESEINRVYGDETKGSEFTGERVVVGGTGDCQELLRVVARVLTEKLGGGEIVVPDSIGSGGGIKAVAAGKIDLARVARPLAEKEKKYGLTYRLFAKSPVVFVVHPSITGIDNITSQQIIDIYSGKITEWRQLGVKQDKIYPVIREPGDSCLRILNENLPGFRNIKRKVATTIYSTPKTVAALVKHKKAIGFLPLSATTVTNLRILKMDGIYPLNKNVISGQYKFAVPYGIVYREDLTGLAKRFVDFLYSEEGMTIIAENGAVPAR